MRLLNLITQTATTILIRYNFPLKNFFFLQAQNNSDPDEADGEFVWETDMQGYILSSFFYGYVITQIPFGILSKRYGNIYFLGVGMLINSVFGFLVPISAQFGVGWLIAVRFIQGLGEVSRYFTSCTKRERYFKLNQIKLELKSNPNSIRNNKTKNTLSLQYLVLVLKRTFYGQGPIVPCTHALLAKWIPPNERSRMGAFVYAGITYNI